jgi:hypothetical protein
MTPGKRRRHATIEVHTRSHLGFAQGVFSLIFPARGCGRLTTVFATILTAVRNEAPSPFAVLTVTAAALSASLLAQGLPTKRCAPSTCRTPSRKRRRDSREQRVAAEESNPFNARCKSVMTRDFWQQGLMPAGDGARLVRTRPLESD